MKVLRCLGRSAEMISCRTRKRDDSISNSPDQMLKLFDEIMDDLKKLIREVPDFPKPGINFYDITTLLKHPVGLRQTVDALTTEFEGMKIDAVIGVEVRGIILTPARAAELAAGCVPA